MLAISYKLTINDMVVGAGYTVKLDLSLTTIFSWWAVGQFVCLFVYY
jgi:hypothetical protein